VANLGTAGLRGLTLHIDWDNNRFALTGRADPAPGHPHLGAAPAGEGPRFGVRARPSDDGTIQVIGTDPGSPAESIGLLAGDRILAINGKPTTELGFALVREELAEPDLSLTVERDGESIRLQRKD
jgi:S1-C subfamily serine protease